MSRPPSKPSSAASRFGLVALLALAGGSGALAQAPLLLEVLINGSSSGKVGEFALLDDGRIAATREALAQVGLKPPPGGAKDELVELTALPEVSFAYDEPGQRILFTAADSRRIAKTYDAASAENNAAEGRSDWGVVFNYTIFASSTEKLPVSTIVTSGVSGFVEARAFTPFGILTQSNIVRARSNGDVSHIRLDTAATYYDVENAVTYKAGDIITAGPQWARPIRVGGVQLRRSFDLRPDLVTLPLPSTEGSAAVPSTVEVYLNGFKTFSQNVDSGPFRLANLPVFGRGGTAQVVVRDALGREVTTTLPFFVSSTLLAPGLLDFSLEAGVPRFYYASERDTYVNLPVGTGSVRYGVTDYLTVQGHGEIGGGVLNAGVGGALRVGSYGVLSGALAGSQFEGRRGYQGLLSFETVLGGVNLYGSTQRTFGAYEDLASVTARMDVSDEIGGWRGFGAPAVARKGADLLFWTAAAPRSIDQISLSVPVPFDTSNLGASFIQRVDASGSRSRIVSASWSRPVFTDAVVYASVFKDMGDRGNTGIMAGLTVPLGSGRVASAAASHTPSGTVISAEAAQGLKLEPGSFGWRVRDTEAGKMTTRSAALAYRGEYARVETAAYQRQTGMQVTAEVEGAIGLLGFAPFAANRIDDAFAVVDAGAPGVQVSYENRPVAKTDWTGRAVIPTLRSFEKSRIAIDPANLPLSANVAQTEHVVVPGKFAGVKLDFGVKTQGGAAVVVLVAPNGTPLQAGLQGRLASGGPDVVTGYDGRTYVAHLTAENTLTVELPRGECTARFLYAAADDQVVIGPVVCAGAEEPAPAIAVAAPAAAAKAAKKGTPAKVSAVVAP